MAHKYETRCWNCGGKELEKTDYGVKCRACGATWTKPIDILPSPLDARGAIIRDKNGKEVVRTGAVSAAHARKVALQRQAHIDEMLPK